MGKKYIIELPENTHWIQWIMQGTKDGHPYMDYKQVEDLTPYAEPDLEQVREDAYQRGYCDALEKHCKICEEKHDAEETYQQGLNDAWECARKIFLPVAQEGLPANALIQIFGNKPTEYILKEYSASEAIEKIRQYEQGKEEIKTGDVVQHKNNPDIKIWVVYADEFNDQMITGIAIENTSDYCKIGEAYINRDAKDWKKTGEHYDMAAVLEKIKETPNV